MAGFTCPPNKFQLLIDALHEHALPPNPPTLEVFEPVTQSRFGSDMHIMEMEQFLAEGSALVQDIIPDLQDEAGFDPNECPRSFEEFCVEQAKQLRGESA